MVMNEVDPWAVGTVESQMTVFQEGLRRWEQEDLEGALQYFRAADLEADDLDAYHNVYTSYHGVALVYKGDLSGLNLCRQAATGERLHAEVYCNLALAEYRLHHRRRAHTALAKGLKIDRRHLRLNRLRLEMGYRRPPILGFLSRDHFLNRILGRATYRSRGRAARSRR